ncbi:MAG: L-dopachrome tautomerase-related protein [Chromatiales bacterium]
MDLVVEGRVVEVTGDEGESEPARVAINPITLSADGETLYFGAMSGTSWYSVPTRLFRSEAPDGVIAAAVVRLGPKPLSDGASTDAQGRHYFTNLRDNAIDVLHPDGRLTRLVQDDRLSWPDALSFGPDGWLYVAVNQLHRSPPFNRGVDRGRQPYLILRVWTGAPGIPGR